MGSDEKKHKDHKEGKQKEKKVRVDSAMLADGSPHVANPNPDRDGSIGTGSANSNLLGNIGIGIDGGGNNGNGNNGNGNNGNGNNGNGNNGNGNGGNNGPLGQDADCTICQEAIGGDEVGRLFPCGHSSFHLPCILQWLATASTCPNCRDDVVSCNGTPVAKRRQPVADCYAELMGPEVVPDISQPLLAPPPFIFLVHPRALLRPLLIHFRSSPACQLPWHLLLRVHLLP